MKLTPRLSPPARARCKAPAPVFWGGYSGYFADPDGHLWELAYNPFCEITLRGETLFSGPSA